MRNKLVFEGKEKAYKWGKYNIGRGTHYNWKKYNTNTRNKYNWKEYAINEVGAKEYFWNEYKTSYQTGYYTFAEIPHNGNQVTGYRWDKYAKIPGETTYSWTKSVKQYKWKKYAAIVESKTTTGNFNNPKYYPCRNCSSKEETVLGAPYNMTLKTNNGYEYDSEYSGGAGYYCAFNSDVKDENPYLSYDNHGIQLGKISGATAGIYSSPSIKWKYDLSTTDPDVDSDGNVIIPSTAVTKTTQLTSSQMKTIIGTDNIVTPTYGLLLILANIPTTAKIRHIYFEDDAFSSWGGNFDRVKKYYKVDYVYGGAIGLNITYYGKQSTSLSSRGFNISLVGVVKGAIETNIVYKPAGYMADVYSTDASAYPQNGASSDGEYWYVADGMSDYEHGYLTTVTSTNRGTYPDDGELNNAYYTYQGSTTAEDTWDTLPEEVFFSWDTNTYPADGTIDGDYKWTKITRGPFTRYCSAEIIDELEFKSQSSESTEQYPLVLRWDTPDKVDQVTFGFYGYDIRGQANWTRTHQYYATDMTSAIVKELATKKAYFQMLPSNEVLSGVASPMYQFTEFSTYSNGKFTNVIKRMSNNVAPSTDADKYYGEYLGAQTQNDNYLQIYGATGKFKSDLIGQVTSTNRSAYPDNGIQNDKWYEFVKEEDTTVQQRGDYIQNVTSYEINGYPEDGVKNGKWYVYQDYDIERYQGSYIETVSSGSATTYPQNGYSAPYWYVYDGSAEDTYKGSFVDYVINTNYSAFPQEGTQDDYWYSYIGETANDIYTITETELAGGVDYTHDINNASDFVIGTAASAQIKFSIKEDVRSAQKYEGLTARWYNQQGSSNEWKQMGRFIITDVNAQDAMTSTLLGYDFISKFDIYVDDWLDGLAFPMTIGNFYKGLCEKVGVDYKTLSFVNSGYSFEDNFTSNNITARQLLQYIAQCAGAYATVDENGVADLRQYLSKDVSLDKTKYTKLNYAYYTITPIGKLTVQMSNNDLGVSAGTGDNIYKITNNPIFYFESEEQALQPVQNVFNIIKQVVYTPCDIDLLEDYGIDCGDIITVDGMTAYIMSKTISASGVKLKCMGNKVREVTGEETNSSINALRGKTNELVRTIEETQSKLTDTANKLESKITQTASELETKITDGDNGLQSQITQTASELTSKITDTKSELETEITQKTDSISATVTSQGELIAQLRIDVDGINLTGYVTFNDLKNSGSTVINGDNITTGTINADRINMTGAINWGDLSSSCQSTIEGMSSGSSVPSYIKSTYIDSTTIMSPTIYGGTITAGTDNDGYLQMAATGMQYYAAGGSILCDIGYQENAKNLPYILLGQGKDSSGTGRGMIKKYVTGLWIGDNEGIYGSSPTGTGIFINFNTNQVYKYINGSASLL